VKKGEVDEEGDVFYDVEEPTQEFLQGSEKGVEEENPSTEKGMLGRMMDKVKSGAQGAKNMGAKALGGSVAFVKDVGVKALKTGVRKGIDYALKPGAFQEDVGKLKNLGDRAVKKVVGGTAVLATKVIKKGVEAAGTAMSYVPVVGGKAKAISDRVVEKFPDDQTIKDKVDKVVDGATYLVGKAGGAAVAVAKKVGGAAVAGTKAVAGKVGEYIPGSVKNVYNNVSKFISDNVGKVKEAGVKKLEAFSVKKGIEMGRSIARKNAQRAKKKTNFFVKIGRMIKKYLPLAFKYVGALIKDSMSPKVDGKRPTAAREKVVRGYFEYLLGVKKIKEGMSDKEIAKIKEGEKNLDTVMVLLKEGLYGADNEARRVARVATGVTLASLMGLDLEKWGNRLMSIIGKRIFDRKVKDETKVDLKAIEKGVIEAEQKAIAAQQAKIKESNLTPGLPGAVTAVKVA